ncbi:uncharacterized protein [Rutidosis leptorrhynchoides]|uniref:uncharacterized protein n=1 Tax=Rutidosis leptorrhynchoides TaxID=125765 RepID=UPI003A994895
MEGNTTKLSLIVLLFSVIAIVVSADGGYGLEGYFPKKPASPTDQYPTSAKVPTKPTVPKEKYESYKKPTPKLPTKPAVPNKEYGTYKKPSYTLPTKPAVPIKEYGTYKKPNVTLPTKPEAPKEHGAYEKNYPKVPTKPVVPEKKYGTYEKTPKPALPNVPEHPKNIAVQGVIYCNYRGKLLPLQGATARVTCLAVHKNGYESAPFSFSSGPANEKGYYLAKLASSKLLKDDMWEIKECKVFLESSPWTSCENPEDTNGGISGSRVIFSRHLNSNGYCLSSVNPFIYNPGYQSLPKEGY